MTGDIRQALTAPRMAILLAIALAIGARLGMPPVPQEEDGVTFTAAPAAQALAVPQVEAHPLPASQAWEPLPRADNVLLWQTLMALPRESGSARVEAGTDDRP